MNLSENDLALVSKLLDVFIGIITIVALRWKWQRPSDGISKKDLIEKIEEKDREIERLTIAHKAWRMRYEHRTKHHKSSDLQKDQEM